MIIDSSAVIAIVREEASTQSIIRALSGARSLSISAPIWFEMCMVLSSPRVGSSPQFLQNFADEFRVEQVAFTPEHSKLATEAWTRFGKGNHPAGLNFGDCMSYATAKLANEPLLFVGDDFAKTDIRSALSVG